jgi:hypothetical protein
VQTIQYGLLLGDRAQALLVGQLVAYLRLTLQMTVERDGRPLLVAGNPATATVQGLLREDDQHRLNRLGIHSTPLMWQFAVDEWCNRDLAGGQSCG